MKIRIKFKPEYLTWIFLFVYMYTLCADADNSTARNIGVIGMVLSQIFCALLRKGKIYKRKIFGPINIWIIAFFCWCALSIIWSRYPDVSYEATFAYFKLVLIIFTLSSLIQSYQDIYCFLRIFITACFCMMVKISIYTPLYTGKASQLWDVICGNYFNSVAHFLAIAICIALFMIEKVDKKIIFKILYVVFIVFAIYHIFLTGSRKGLLMPIMEIALYKYFDGRLDVKKILKYVVAVIGFAILAFIFLSQNAYTAERIKQIFDFAFTGDTSDGSTLERVYLIQLASQMFSSSPIIGCGVNTFGISNAGVLGKNIYCHNNYLEIMSGLGIIGLFLYYVFYGRTIYTAYKNRFCNSFNAVVLSIFITLAVFEIGIVTYSIFVYPILLTVLAISLQIIKLEEKYYG